MKRKNTYNVFCLTYGHNYFRLNHGNENTPELVCKCCKTFFNFENDGSITPVDFKEIENTPLLLEQKKTA